jgi:FtsP/CotA-like multicopper oxidase with cupredoxin domain
MKSYRFWFLAAVSALLVVTFVWYLPLRFEHSAGNETGEHDDHSDGAHAGHALPDASSIAKLPLRTPDTGIDTLPFIVDEDGVKEFRLEANEFRWEYEPGKYIHAWGYNGQIPGPEIRVTEGDRVRVIVKNNLPEATTVHWHSLDVEWEADGVANLTQEPIEPGEEYVYEFTARPGGETGTRFYHSHGKDHITAAQQMDMGLTGPLVVEPKRKLVEFDREYTLLLDEWDVLSGGVNPAVAHIHGAATEGAIPEYNTFTINGRVFPYIDPIKVREGEQVLIRVINGGTTAMHPMHTHGHNFELIALDGNLLREAAQQRRSTYTVHPGETADFLLTADNPGNWLFHCHHVHHASAGMIMLVEYEDFDGPDTADLQEAVKGMSMAAVMEAMDHDDEGDDHAHTVGTPEDHAHEEEAEAHDHDAHEHETGQIQPLVSSAWWILVISSLFLMSLLSIVVYKFIHVKK